MSLWNPSHPFGSNAKEKASAIEIVLGITLFLLPFFFLPFTYDLIEINKTYLFIFSSVIIFLIFAFQGFQKGSLYIKSLNYYIPFGLLLLASAISVFFSPNTRHSLFGNYGSYLNSYMVIVALCLLSFVVINIKLNLKVIINYLIFGVTLALILAFAGSYSGVVPILSKIFPSNILAESYGAFLGMTIFSVCSGIYFLYLDKKKDKSVLGFYPVIVLGLIYLFVNPNLYALIALFAIIGYFVLTEKDFRFSDNSLSITIIGVLVAVITILHYIPPVKSALGFTAVTIYPRVDIVTSWYVAAAAITSKPFWGVGLNHYLPVFSEFRPAYLNTGEFWNLRYTFAFNDVFGWLTTAGVLGVSAYLWFLYFIVKKSFNRRESDVRDPILPLVIVMSVILLLTLGYSLVLYIILFASAAILLQNDRGSVFALKTKSSILFVLSLALIILGGLIYQSYWVYTAQIYLNSSLKSDNLLNRYEFQRLALRHNPYDPVLYRNAMNTNLAIALVMSKQKDLSSEQKASLENVLKQAINDSVYLTEALDPLTSSNWEIRGFLNKSLIPLDKEDKKFSTVAAQSYMAAITKDPSNPLLRINLGNIFYQNKDYAKAANYFVQAIQLKPDYANSYYNLAYVLKDAGDYQNALTQMQVVQRLISTEGEEAENVKKEIEALTKLVEENKNKTNTNTSAAVDLPDSVKSPKIDDTDGITQQIAGPEEDAGYQLKSSENLDVQPAEVKKEEDVNLKNSDLN